MSRIWHPIVRHMEGCPAFLDYSDEEHKQIVTFLGRFKPDEEVEMIIRKKQSVTSSRQNKYYWAVIIHAVSEFTGHTPEEIHDILKWKFLKQKDEKGFDYVPSSMSLTTADRERYHKSCREWAQTVFNLNIPLPNEAE